MKYNKIFFRTLFCLSATVALASCDNDDLIVGGADTGVIGAPDGNVVYVTDAIGQSDGSMFTFSGSGTFNLYARTSKAIQGNCSVTFNYDADVLTAYNAANATDYEAVKSDMVVFANDGVASFEAGALKSSPLAVTVNGAGELNPDRIYALPLSFTVSNGQTVGGVNSVVVLLRDTSKYPGADKTYNGIPGMKMIAVVEVNDHNPLNVMGFTLKDSGKQLFDMVVLFSANINYNDQTGRVYVSRNENVQAILDNRDKYIKPLQDRGIKVILGVMGNHDMSGISTLTPGASKEFAREVKQICDAYQLDGVFLDDEWTKYDQAASTDNPLFQKKSYEAASRMAYDIKMAQPERLVLSYKWDQLYYGVPIEGKQPGEFFDYVLNDYCDEANPVDTYPGLRQDQAGTGSWNCIDADWYKARWMPGFTTDRGDKVLVYNDMFSLTGMREQGYGALMIFNFYNNPAMRLTESIIKNLGLTAKAFYNADLQYDGIYYPADWK